MFGVGAELRRSGVTPLSAFHNGMTLRFDLEPGKTVACQRKAKRSQNLCETEIFEQVAFICKVSQKGYGKCYFDSHLSIQLQVY